MSGLFAKSFHTQFAISTPLIRRPLFMAQLTLITFLIWKRESFGHHLYKVSAASTTAVFKLLHQSSLCWRCLQCNVGRLLGSSLGATWHGWRKPIEVTVHTFQKGACSYKSKGKDYIISWFKLLLRELLMDARHLPMPVEFWSVLKPVGHANALKKWNWSTNTLRLS